MNIYIFAIIGSTVLFSIQFLIKKLFQKNEGSTPGIALFHVFLSTVFSILFLIIKGGSTFEFTLFSFFIASLNGIRAVIQTFMTFAILEKANLSVYSLFSQLGGTFLPFVFAILFYNEPLTWQKTLCMILLGVALYCQMYFNDKKNADYGTQKKSNNRLSILMLYIGVFVLTGLSGVFAKINQTAPAEIAVSPSAFTLLEKLITLLLAGILILVFRSNGMQVRLVKPAKSLFYICTEAVLNTIGNLILLTALYHVDASIQYPIVTGGIIILSLFLEPISGTKPQRQTIIAAVFSCIGLCFLAL